jgi:uncharacterized protein (UPF0210 family)
MTFREYGFKRSNIFTKDTACRPLVPCPTLIEFSQEIHWITYFINHYPLNDHRLKVAGDFISNARPAFEQAGYEVQSTRLATIPFPELLPRLVPGELARLARELEVSAVNLGYAYISLGPALPELPNSYELVPEALAATQNAFFSGLMTTADSRVSLLATRRCAQVIQEASTISADGFANMRFAALANVPAGSPFFPAAYHRVRTFFTLMSSRPSGDSLQGGF